MMRMTGRRGGGETKEAKGGRESTVEGGEGRKEGRKKNRCTYQDSRELSNKDGRVMIPTKRIHQGRAKEV